MDSGQKTDYSGVVKIILVIALFPFVVVWYVWTKTNWTKQNKWIVTAAVAVLSLLIINSSNGSATTRQAEAWRQAEKIKQEPVQQRLVEKEDVRQEPEQQVIAEVAEQENVPEEVFKVTRVVDGDTIQLENGQKVRYIGIDTPETVDPRKPVQCFGKEASDKNKELVEGQEVRLVKDTSETDKYDRLLRYVYVGDTFVNDYLVRNGYAHSSSYPPDIKNQDQLRLAEQEARENKRGLWADNACKEDVVEAPIVSAVATGAAAASVVESTPSSGGVVKKSTTSICHAPGTTYYAKTKNYTPYNSIEECLKSGGRLPKR